MTSKGYVEFIGVNKTYDGRTVVVNDLNLQIAKGEFLTMLGPSGSGKTTSLMMLAGFEAPSSGDIRLGGRSLQAVPPYHRNIGMVFQSYALFPHMTVAENVAYPLSVRRMTKAEIRERVSRALDMVRMSAFSDRKPAQLSGGQQQRIALARSIVFEPDVVLMDEPLGALDKNLREHLQLEIKHLHERLGITVVYVTHDQSEALTMSDRVAVFNAGRVEQLAPPSVLYESPDTPFVASFIGENNCLKGRIVGRNGHEYAIDHPHGLRTVVHSTKAFVVNQEVLVSVRPERVRLIADNETMPNRLSGLIEEIIYLGDHKRVHIKLDQTASLVAKVPNISGEAQLTPKQNMLVGWDVSDAVLLAAH